jgi:hypothetical protein
MPSVTAQDPASKPVRIAEGIFPLRMRHGNFVISGTVWRKFNANRPWLTFTEFWLIKEHAYNRRNASCTRKRVPSYKVTDGSHRLLQGRDSKHISEDWPKKS